MDRSQLRQLARTNAWGRTVIGASLVAAPGAVATSWVGADQLTDGAKVLARAVGARDVALGLGVNFALSKGGPARGWLEASALADAVDAAATVVAWRSLPPAGRVGVLAIAAVSAVQCALVARAIDG
jgi:hypothetical protein